MSGRGSQGYRLNYSRKVDLTAEVCSRLHQQLHLALQTAYLRTSAFFLCLFVSVFLSLPPDFWEALLRNCYLNSLSFLNSVFFLSENFNSCTSCSCSWVMYSLTSAVFWLLGSTVRKHHLPFLCIEICSLPWVLCTWVSPLLPRTLLKLILKF